MDTAKEQVQEILRMLPEREAELTLEQLVGQITPANRHEETDTGPAVGREALVTPG